MLAPGAAACRVAIVQSNYVPWKGYFDLIGSVSKFVLLDSVQFTTRDWRNRNRIKTPHGTQWLTIPVQHKGRRTQPIDGTEVVSSAWAAQHWKTIGQNYSKAPFFDLYRDVLADAYRRAGEEPSLSRVNHILLTAVLGILGIDTPMIPSSDFSLPTGATERLLKLCQLLGATERASLLGRVPVRAEWNRHLLRGLQRVPGVSPAPWRVRAHRHGLGPVVQRRA
jgi:hypothetical protein